VQQKIAWLKDGEIFVQAPYNKEFTDECRSIEGRRWDADTKTNVFPLSAMPYVRTLMSKWHIPQTDELSAVFKSEEEEYTSVEGYDDNVYMLNTGEIAILFPYNPTLIGAIRAIIPSAIWDSKSKFWVVDALNVVQVLTMSKIYGLRHSPEFDDFVKMVESKIKNIGELSSETDGPEMDIPGLTIELLPYQRAGVDYISKMRKVILGDQPGLGKTIQSLSAVALHNAYPCVVVCPNTLKTNWAREIEKCFPSLTVTTLFGTKSDVVKSADIIIVNYDIVAERASDIINHGYESLIVDESHYIKNGKRGWACPDCGESLRGNAQNCKACSARNIKPIESWSVKRTGGVIRLAKQLAREKLTILLTGTPVTNRPTELIPQLEAVGLLEHFGGAWRFQNRYAPARNVATNTSELNRRLKESCFIRRLKADVYGELPPLRNSVQYLEVSADKMDWYKAVEADTIEYFAQKARLLAEEEGADGDKAYWQKRINLADSEHIIKVTALRDAAAKVKYDSIIAWVDNFLESGDQKVIIFAEHVELVEALYERYKDVAVKIRGGVSNADRQLAVDKFQNDPLTRVFVGNMSAASEGLTLTAASDVVFCELAWTPTVHEQCAARAYGRANDLHGATAWYLLLENTIDESIYSLLQRKKKVVDAITDGLDTSDSGGIMGDLILELAERGLNDTRSID
jgi:SWI/SNF-related matrix-associated actin-dependent regulator 1 of chromatin subfamily A